MKGRPRFHHGGQRLPPPPLRTRRGSGKAVGAAPAQATITRRSGARIEFQCLVCCAFHTLFPHEAELRGGVWQQPEK